MVDAKFPVNVNGASVNAEDNVAVSDTDDDVITDDVVEAGIEDHVSARGDDDSAIDVGFVISVENVSIGDNFE